MSLLVVMTMMLSLLCGTVFATEATETTETEVVINPATVIDGTTQEEAIIEINRDITANGCDGAILAKNGAQVSITGGKIHGQLCTVDHDLEDETNPLCGYSMAVWASTNSVITIHGGDFTHDHDTVNDPSHDDLIYASGEGHIVINGGTFTCQTPKWTLNCKDGSGSTITVKGGKFYKFNPLTAGVVGSENYVGTNEIIVPVGYEVVQNGDWYEVVETEAHRFRDALAYGGTVSLSKDVTETSESMDAANIITRNTNVDFGTHTFTLDTGNVANWAALRVQFGNVTLSGTTGGIRVANTADGGANIGELYAVLVGTKSEDSNPVVTITGGNYIGGTSAVSVTKGTLKITGGYFEALTSNKTYTINCIDEYYRDGSANVEISGGTFVGYNPDNSASENPRASFIVDGYKSVESKDSQGRTIYTVVCAHKSLAGYPHKESTYVEEGCQAYYECNNCHKLFMDAAATQEVADKADLVIPKLIEIKGTEAVVSDAAVLGAIQKSEDSAVVELPVLETNKTVKEVTVPVASVEAVAEQDKGLLIETSDVTVTLDAKTVATVAEEAKDATSVTIEVTKEETKVLNKAQKEAVKNKEVEVVISAKILADGKEISDFKGGKVTVEIPFKPAEGLKASDYKFVYIDDNGKVTEIPSKYFDGVMVVELEHFSEYAIVRDVPVTNEGGTGSVPEAAPAPAPTPAAPVKDNTPKTGAISVIGLVSAMAVGGLVLTRKRK